MKNERNGIGKCAVLSLSVSILLALDCYLIIAFKVVIVRADPGSIPSHGERKLLVFIKPQITVTDETFV